MDTETCVLTNDVLYWYNTRCNGSKHTYLNLLYYLRVYFALNHIKYSTEVKPFHINSSYY